MSVQYCKRHDQEYVGLLCPICEATQRRDTINSLKAQVDDQAAELMQLRMRVVDLEHLHNSDAAAHNALARHSEQLLTQVERMLAQPGRIAQ